MKESGATESWLRTFKRESRMIEIVIATVTFVVVLTLINRFVLSQRQSYTNILIATAVFVAITSLAVYFRS